MDKDIPVLLIENDALDVKNVERAFKENNVHNPLYVTSNGEEALAFLRNTGPYADPETAPGRGSSCWT